MITDFCGPVLSAPRRGRLYSRAVKLYTIGYENVGALVEADEHVCHRLRVAEEMARRFGFTVEHLHPEGSRLA